MLRFQKAINAYHLAIGGRAVVTEDGIYDTTTDTLLADLTNTPGFPACALAFTPSAPAFTTAVSDPRYDPSKSTLALAQWGATEYGPALPSMFSPTFTRSV